MSIPRNPTAKAQVVRLTTIQTLAPTRSTYLVGGDVKWMREGIPAGLGVRSQENVTSRSHLLRLYSPHIEKDREEKQKDQTDDGRKHPILPPMSCLAPTT
ncbi:hypothetical protein LZ554_006572 [Drepanopeziza brunnea f. sp. 'monogermtubi']|nr:hypothetical protein LZ554_006572 [Drepanopeziza brunnea f. sp. 'monogermtubi']